MYTCSRCKRVFKHIENLTLHKRHCDLIPDWILELDDDYKLKCRYTNKKVNARKENSECLLTYEQFCQLVKEAKLKSSDLGFSSGKKYVLARFNDTGDYTIGNCRFITQQENIDEREISSRSREQSSLNIKRYNSLVDRHKGTEEYRKWLEKFNSSDYMKNLKNKPPKVVITDPRYSKEHNSQFGTYWITNGVLNLKWSDSKGTAPEGYYRGRIVYKPA